MTLELATPNEILAAVIVKMKEKQKLLGYSNANVAKETGIGKSAYDNFLYNNNISLINLIKVLRYLELNKELNVLMNPNEPNSAEELKKLEKLRERNQNKVQKTNERTFTVVDKTRLGKLLDQINRKS